jgi:hypothetical protein
MSNDIRIKLIWMFSILGINFLPTGYADIYNNFFTYLAYASIYISIIMAMPFYF